MKFTINGNEYEGAKYNYNTHCDMKALGVDITKFADNPEGAMRAYFAVSSGMNLSMAGDEIEAHIIGGGSLNDLLVCLSEEVQNSGFFQALKDNKEPKKPSKKE